MPDELPPPPPPPDPRIAQLETEMATMRIANARLQALSEFPLADAELINSLTEIEQISAHAQRTHTREEAHRTELDALKQQQRVGQEGSPSPPAGADPAATEQEAKRRRLSTQLRHPTMRKQVDVVDAEIAQEDFFKQAWNLHMEQRKQAGLKTAPDA